MKAVFFNAKGILYERPDPHYYLRTFLESNGLHAPSENVLQKIMPDLKNQVMRGRLRKEVYSDGVLKACGLTNTFLFEQGRQSLERDHKNIILLPGVISTLEGLKGRGFKLGIITDSYVSKEEKTGWMRDRGLNLQWDAYANSKDLEALKPDLSLFQTAMQQAQVRPAESTFVGTKQIEIQAAKSLGMTSIAFRCGTEIQADHNIQKFEELLNLPFLQSPS